MKQKKKFPFDSSQCRILFSFFVKGKFQKVFLESESSFYFDLSSGRKNLALPFSKLVLKWIRKVLEV
ncbi:hypothetical protein DLM78_09675 [Leptospira stimsonii]|uniref:Uncharacterized protein n=1 Tax=Leptospira stimsonii TaxID=2202203 RepID=A0A8B3CPM6_9LEPT|nr:hypothetical protein DLM78_09675 [Leptospira stimsonii]